MKEELKICPDAPPLDEDVDCMTAPPADREASKQASLDSMQVPATPHTPEGWLSLNVSTHIQVANIY